MFDSATRESLIRRIRALTPDTPRAWGKMTAPQMIAHLSDQMRLTLGDSTAEPIRDFRSWPGVKYLAIHVIPWPKGRVVGPAAAFVTKPAEWTNDVNNLIALVERFGALGPSAPWGPHVIFGPMSSRDWGVFCHKHFDHHLRQFGQ